jgi:TRAP-type transport system small permease protein
VILRTITLVLLGVMLASVLLGVADRFLFGLGLAWTEELARFCLIWTSLLAAALAAREGRHFRLEILGARIGRWRQLATGVIGSVALAIVIWYGARLALFFHRQTSPALGIPMSWVYAAVPVSASLMIACLLRDLYTALRPRAASRD